MGTYPSVQDREVKCLHAESCEVFCFSLCDGRLWLEMMKHQEAWETDMGEWISARVRNEGRTGGRQGDKHMEREGGQ